MAHEASKPMLSFRVILALDISQAIIDLHCAFNQPISALSRLKNRLSIPAE
jgi:hypothetical protein